MDVWIIILAGLLAVFIAAITVGFQSLKSSLQNPVKNLRGK
jgi:putative ABC transport system permease protein